MKSIRRALVVARSISTRRHNACLSYSTEATATVTTQTQPNITIFGGNGFIGSHIVKKVAQNAASVRIACRNPKEFNAKLEQAVSADPSSPLAKVKAEYADIAVANSVRRSVQDADVVINCVNIHHEVNNNWAEILVDGVKHICHESHISGVKQLLHFSCLGAVVDHKSNWSDYKYRSEDMALASFPNTTVIRPGLTFGPGDRLMNRVLESKMPAIIVPNTGALIQPVFVDDVVAAVEKIIFDQATAASAAGKIFQLGGLERFTLAQLIEKFIVADKASKRAVEVPYFVADFIVGILQFLPDPIITRDHTPVLKMDMVTSSDGFQQLGIKPHDINEALASYLGKGSQAKHTINLTQQ